MSIRCLKLKIILLGLLPGLVTAQQLPLACDWLDRMNHAISTMNYEGHFVYQHGNSLEAMRIRHSVGDKGPEEHLQSLNGVIREVIKSKNRITVIETDAGKVRVRQRNAAGRISPLPDIELDDLPDYYNLVMGGAARVAGRAGQVIALEPKDKYRYGYRLTLDKGTALPLDVAVLNTDGEPVSRIMYTDLSVSLPEPDQAESPGGEAAVLPISINQVSRKIQLVPSEAVDIEKVSRWKFSTMPQGFRLKNYQLKKLGQSKGKLEHFVFSDGLATISVYVEPYVAGSALSGNASLAAVNAIGRRHGDYQLTVVGEVPADALTLVLNGAERKR